MQPHGTTKQPLAGLFCLAEEERFELSVPCGTLAFQASALDHYATPPGSGIAPES
jgi:hypothetical protein